MKKVKELIKRKQPNKIFFMMYSICLFCQAAAVSILMNAIVIFTRSLSQYTLLLSQSVKLQVSADAAVYSH